MPGMTWITDCSTLLATTHSQVTTANPTPSVATVSAVRRGLRPRAATASRSVGPAEAIRWRSHALRRTSASGRAAKAAPMARRKVATRPNEAARGYAGGPDQQALRQELEPYVRRPEPHRAHHTHLPDACLEHRREAVEYDEERRQEHEKAHSLQHDLHRPHDPMEIHLPLGRSCHLEAFGKNRSEGVPDDRHFPIACDNDVHAVDEPRAGECPLRGEEVHHDEVAAVNTPDALG